MNFASLSSLFFLLLETGLFLLPLENGMHACLHHLPILLLGLPGKQNKTGISGTSSSSQNFVTLFLFPEQEGFSHFLCFLSGNLPYPYHLRSKQENSEGEDDSLLPPFYLPSSEACHLGGDGGAGRLQGTKHRQTGTRSTTLLCLVAFCTFPSPCICLSKILGGLPPCAHGFPTLKLPLQLSLSPQASLPIPKLGEDRQHLPGPKFGRDRINNPREAGALVLTCFQKRGPPPCLPPCLPCELLCGHAPNP